MMRTLRPPLAALLLTILAFGDVISGAGGQNALRVTLFARAVRPGEVVKTTVACPCAATGVSATVFGKDVPLARTADDEWEGLIGIDLDVKPRAYTMSVRVNREGQPPLAARRTVGVLAKRFPVRRLTVDPSFVNPDPAQLARTQDEARRLAAVFEMVTTPRQWNEPFRAPVAAPANSSFGTRSIFNGERRSPHSGADFAAAEGTPIAAPAAGTIVMAEPLFFTGNTVVIDHGLGLYSLLAHMSGMAVHPGDRVKPGELVGFVGATGRVTAPHLHWSARLNGARVDPLSLMAATADRKAAR